MPNSYGEHSVEISRRSVGKTAAWAVPAAIASVSAPAFATSSTNEPRPIAFRSASNVSMDRYYYGNTGRTTVDFYTNSGPDKKNPTRPGFTAYDLKSGDVIKDITITYWFPEESYYAGDLNFQPQPGETSSNWSTLSRDTTVMDNGDAWGTRMINGVRYYAYTTKYIGNGGEITGVSGTISLPPYAFYVPQYKVQGDTGGESYKYYFRCQINMNGQTQARYGGTATPPGNPISFGGSKK